MYKCLLKISLVLLFAITSINAGTVAYYSFEEGTDGSGSSGVAPDTSGWVLDSSTSSLNGTVINVSEFPEYSLETSVSAPGNMSMRFAEEGNCFTASNSSAFQFSENTSRTIEFFVCRAGDGLDPSAMEFVMSKDYGLFNGWDMSFSRETGFLSFRIKNNTVSSQTDFSDGQWHHVAITHEANSATYKLYVDYRQEAVLSYGSGSVSEGNFCVGTGFGWQNLRSFNGYVDELRFSDEALTVADMIKIEIDKASFPKPGDSAIISDISPTLRWIAGKSAITHRVYFGKSEDSLVFQAETSSLSWATGQLEPATTYYWRIDAVNSASQDSPWVGDVWDFATEDYVLLEDFEAYSGDTELEANWVVSQDDPNNLQSSEFDSVAQNVYYAGDRGLKMVYDFAVDNTSTVSFSPSYTNWDNAAIKSISVFVLAPVSNDVVDVDVVLSDGTNSYSATYSDFALLTDGLWHEMNIDISGHANIDFANIESLSFSVSGETGSGKIYFDNIKIYIQRATGVQSGDLTGDYMVTLDDFAMLASQWHQDNLWP